MEIGSKIDYKTPGSGRGRPSSGTITGKGDMLTIVTRLGATLEIDPAWVVGEHKGTYARKTAEAEAAPAETAEA